MPVICLNKFQKKYIKHYFYKAGKTVTELAIDYSVSRRTIRRVLDEVTE
jgi:transcriptional antiterminator